MSCEQPLRNSLSVNDYFPGFTTMAFMRLPCYLVALQRHNAAVALDPSAWMHWNYTQALAVAEAGLAAN